MDDSIQPVDIPSVYDYLLRVDRTDSSYLETASLIARFSFIFPGDEGWWNMVVRQGDRANEMMSEGLKVVGVALEGKCIGCCGYRITTDPYIVVKGKKVQLPYEMFLAIDDGAEAGADLVYSAQMSIASYEHLEFVQLAV
ncbi:MAG: hypothetical protein SA339_04155 [Methanomassiliicoccus sp.]|nr:hypothetical protein [Methanomassiliicoccus sp.]